MQKIQLNIEEHVQQVAKSPNGLVIHSAIHRCDDGLLGISNLHIDANFAIRSFSILEFPSRTRPTAIPVPGLPVPKSDLSEIKNKYIITQMQTIKGFRLIIVDHRLNALLNIGKVDEKNEEKISRITSDLGMVYLDYYPSEMPLNTHTEKWLMILVNHTEILPPTKIGLFIETLRFIHDLHRTPPSTFLIKQLQTLLTSHETYFTLIKVTARFRKIKDIALKYGEDIAILSKTLLEFLEENPIIPLQDYVKAHNRDLLYLIRIFLILEQEKLLIIERPGIIEEED
jgi:hypothetical protein